MQYNTKKLIIELLRQELAKSNRIPTLFYHEEVKVTTFLVFFKKSLDFK